MDASPPPALAVLTSRELAEATAFRTRYGLPADEEWIRLVAARPDLDAAIMEYGVPLTPEEVADLRSREWDPDVQKAVREYGLTFPEDFAGAWNNQQASGVIAAFKNDTDRHRRALANLVPPGSNVEVIDVEWSRKDLEGFAADVEAEQDWFDATGIDVELLVHNPFNKVVLQYRGPAETATAIKLHFRDPSWLLIEHNGALPWTGPRGDLVIHVTDSKGRPVRALQCDPESMDPRAGPHGEAVFATDRSGTCTLRNVPAVTWLVRLREPLSTGGFSEASLMEISARITGDNVTEIDVVVPAP